MSIFLIQVLLDSFSIFKVELTLTSLYSLLDGRSTLLALIQSNGNNIKMIRLLLEIGANPTVQDSEGRTSLHLAAAMGDENCLSLLLQFAHTLELVDKSGCTALQTAVQYGQLAFVKLIIANGSKININNQDRHGQTALSMACQMGQIEIVYELLEHGAYIYASARNPIKIAHQGIILECVYNFLKDNFKIFLKKIRRGVVAILF